MESKTGKLLYSLLTIFLGVSLIFFIVRLAPGDPVERILGPEASLKEVTSYRAELGLDKPFVYQYLSYLKGLLHGDLGNSLFKKKPVFDLVVTHMKPTMILALVSILISAPLGTLFGIYAGFKKSGAFDNASRVLSLIILSFPIFSLAPILVLIFSIKLNLLPVSEWTSLKHMILPIVTLVLPLASVVSRVARNKYLEERGEPWVQVLEAKGLSNSSVLIRLIKVCMPTILNIVAIQLSVVLAGTMITETIFDIPGMGLLLFESISNRDYPIVQGVIIYSTIIYMAVYFVIDFVNSIIDPRIKG